MECFQIYRSVFNQFWKVLSSSLSGVFCFAGFYWSQLYLASLTRVLCYLVYQPFVLNNTSWVVSGGCPSLLNYLWLSAFFLHNCLLQSYINYIKFLFDYFSDMLILILSFCLLDFKNKNLTCKFCLIISISRYCSILVYWIRATC